MKVMSWCLQTRQCVALCYFSSVVAWVLARVLLSRRFLIGNVSYYHLSLFLPPKVIRQAPQGSSLTVKTKPDFPVDQNCADLIFQCIASLNQLWWLVGYSSFWSGVARETVVVEADAFKETDIIYQTLQSMDDVAGTSELVCGVSVSSDRSQFESDLLVQ